MILKIRSAVNLNLNLIGSTGNVLKSVYILCMNSRFNYPKLCHSLGILFKIYGSALYLRVSLTKSVPHFSTIKADQLRNNAVVFLQIFLITWKTVQLAENA